LNKKGYSYQKIISKIETALSKMNLNFTIETTWLTIKNPILRNPSQPIDPKLSTSPKDLFENFNTVIFIFMVCDKKSLKTFKL
jgi:hypothetical protein